jgi:hypothetical protein
MASTLERQLVKNLRTTKQIFGIFRNGLGCAGLTVHGPYWPAYLNMTNF